MWPKIKSSIGEGIRRSYEAARNEKNHQRGEALLRGIVEITRSGSTPFSMRLEEALKDGGIEKIFYNVPKWEDVPKYVAPGTKDPLKRDLDWIADNHFLCGGGAVALAVLALFAGGAAFPTIQNVYVPKQPSLYGASETRDIKKSMSGKTLYEIVEPYIGKAKELSLADAKEIISLTSGRYIPSQGTFSGNGINFRIWNPGIEPESMKELYVDTRGNLGQSLGPSTTLADVLNRVVLRDNDNTIKSITIDFVKKNYGVDVTPQDISVERISGNLFHDVKYTPNGKPKATVFSTPTGHINFLREHTLFIPYEAMKQ